MALRSPFTIQITPPTTEFQKSIDEERASTTTRLAEATAFKLADAKPSSATEFQKSIDEERASTAARLAEVTAFKLADAKPSSALEVWELLSVVSENKSIGILNLAEVLSDKKLKNDFSRRIIARTLGDVITKNTRVHTLKMSHTRLNLAAATLVINAFKESKCSAITRIDLSHSDFGGAQGIIDLLLILRRLPIQNINLQNSIPPDQLIEPNNSPTPAMQVLLRLFLEPIHHEFAGKITLDQNVQDLIRFFSQERELLFHSPTDAERAAFVDFKQELMSRRLLSYFPPINQNATSPTYPKSAQKHPTKEERSHRAYDHVRAKVDTGRRCVASQEKKLSFPVVKKARGEEMADVENAFRMFAHSPGSAVQRNLRYAHLDTNNSGRKNQPSASPTTKVRAVY
jgi:hypothetical protein